MATIDHPAPQDSSGHLETTDNEKAYIATAEHVERTRTAETEMAHKNIAVDAKLDEFGARSKIDPLEIALVKKLDRTILPMLWIMYFFNFLDRNALVNAKLNSLDEDLGLVGTQYNTLISILFVGYIAGQIPSNMILNRVRPSWYLGGFCLAWSITCLLTYLANDFGSMLACRFMLGVTEAPFYPGALFLLSLFYTKKEIATRMAIFYTGNMMASSFAGLIAAGVFAGLDGTHGLAGWRWLFIIQGALSIGVALVSFFLLPDHPLNTRWLTPEQRQLAHTRIAADTTQREEATSVMVGLRQALVDWRTWVFCLMYNMHVSSVSFQSFLPTVVRTLGYNTTTTLALTCPPYLLAAVMAVVMSYTSGRYNERTWHITCCKAIIIVGFIIPAVTTNVAARMVAIFLFVTFSFGINNIMLGWVSATLGQTPEKKAVALALCNSIGNLSSVYTPYLWPSSDRPRFLKAWMAAISFSIVAVVAVWAMRISLQRKNKNLKQSQPDTLVFYVY
ncbi:MFS transporter-like protein [Plenodomus tracheiphilus IPT5]|uniref:MFS transporter-like protein n=1 Tax=Plenodomus tracheiphilus IPT5 TaxID=1408161 RepID=A0A6A7BAK0_9PLEO|nr:MFS transporter-like protein [Plenodomus tracheiphilus IPT5]